MSIVRVAGLLLLLSLVVPGALAQVYEWRDAQGRLIYGDMPPVGVEARLVQGSSTRRQAQTEPPAESSAEDAASLRRQAEQAAARAHNEAELNHAEEQRRFEEELQASCADARQRLSVLESGRRVAVQDESGEQRLLDRDRRTEEIMQTMQFINDNCGPAQR